MNDECGECIPAPSKSEEDIVNALQQIAGPKDRVGVIYDAADEMRLARRALRRRQAVSAPQTSGVVERATRLIRRWPPDAHRIGSSSLVASSRMLLRGATSGSMARPRTTEGTGQSLLPQESTGSADSR